MYIKIIVLFPEMHFGDTLDLTTAAVSDVEFSYGMPIGHIFKIS